MNLEQQKKRARELLRGLRAGEPDAIRRLRRHHGRWADVDEARLRQDVALHDAQLVLAREQGFASWPKLKGYAEPPAGSRHTHLFVADLDWVDERVQGLLRVRASAVPAAFDQIREWHPRFADASDAVIREAAFDERDARLVYARAHGFDGWDELAARIDALAQGRAEEPFLSAFEAMRTGNLARLGALLGAHPQLAHARGTNGNSLLNLGVSLAGCVWHDAPAMRDLARAGIDALLAAGADVDEPNDRGWTPLHQAAYSNLPDLAERLIAAGASLDAEAHGAGGTPLVVSLFWGHREVADRLAAHGLAPRNLRAAAGVGDLALVNALVGADGVLAPEAGTARGFYRPHSGFPDWQPSTDSQEVLDEALVWACKSDRVDVLTRLVQAGARIHADPYRGTPLIWAAACNRPRTVAWLLDRGADVNQRATFGGPSHGQGVTALHIAAQSGHLAVVTLLVERGADLAIQDDLYQGTPTGWAEHGGHDIVRDYLRARQSAGGGAG